MATTTPSQKWDVLFILATIGTIAASAASGFMLLLTLSHGEYSPIYNDEATWSESRNFALLMLIPAAAMFYVARRQRPESVSFAVRWTAATALWAWVIAGILLVLDVLAK